MSEQHVDKLEKKFKPGQKVRARVIGKQSMDGMATATMKVRYLWTCSAYFPFFLMSSIALVECAAFRRSLLWTSSS